MENKLGNDDGRLFIPKWTN